MDTHEFKVKMRECFEIVKKHLLTQNAKSQVKATDSWCVANGCAYRGYSGRKCAVGCLIPDEMYNSSMEGNNVPMLSRNVELRRAWGLAKLTYSQEACFLDLLEKLRQIHDDKDPYDWANSLDNVNLEEFFGNYSI